METGDTHVGTDRFFLFLSYVVAVQDLPVPDRPDLVQNLADDFRVLVIEQLTERAGGRIGDEVSRLDASGNLALSGLTKVLNREIARQPANEPGEPFGFADVTVSDLLQGNPKTILAEVFDRCALVHERAEDNRHSTAVSADEFFFRVTVTCDDSCHEACGRGVRIGLIRRVGAYLHSPCKTKPAQ